MNKDFYYGKIDNFGNFIIPKKEKFLKFENTLMFKEVSEIFIEMKKEIKILNMRGILKDFQDLKLNSIFEDFEEKYNSHIEEIIQKITENYIQDLDNVHIKNKYDFMNYFEKYLEYFKFFPISKIGYFCSNLNPIIHSGLVYEFDNHDYNDENYKTSKYFQNQNFQILKSVFLKYGFHISEEIPWRFYVDLSSEKISNKFTNLSQKNHFKDLHINNILKELYEDFKLNNEFLNILLILNKIYKSFTNINKDLKLDLIDLHISKDLKQFFKLFFNFINNEFKLNINILINLKARAHVYMLQEKNLNFPLDKREMNDYLFRCISQNIFTPQTFEPVNL